MKPLIVIPTRMASQRFPGKPLAEIGGAPMIVQVWRRAIESAVGPVLVASGDPEITAAIRAAGGEVVDTTPDHPSGSDRIFEAVEQFDPGGTHDIIVNLQGDMPTLDPALVAATLTPLADPTCDIATLAAVIKEDRERTDPNVTKAVISFGAEPGIGRALYFTRAEAPAGEGPLYHHIGIYAYRREALKRFVSLPPSPLEQRERLEQLRALEAGMVIKVAIVDTIPDGVDTPEDLERAKAQMNSE